MNTAQFFLRHRIVESPLVAAIPADAEAETMHGARMSYHLAALSGAAAIALLSQRHRR